MRLQLIFTVYARRVASCRFYENETTETELLAAWYRRGKIASSCTSEECISMFLAPDRDLSLSHVTLGRGRSRTRKDASSSGLVTLPLFAYIYIRVKSRDDEIALRHAAPWNNRGIKGSHSLYTFPFRSLQLYGIIKKKFFMFNSLHICMYESRWVLTLEKRFYSVCKNVDKLSSVSSILIVRALRKEYREERD